jgi:hypothetical protein
LTTNRLLLLPDEIAVMRAAEGDRKLVADLLSQSARLRKPQMMGIAGLPAADEAGLFGHKAQVDTVWQPSRLRQSKNAFVDPGVGALPGAFRFGGWSPV